jgi:hypothetical protein
MRTTHTGILSVFAECRSCGWNSWASNALGNAAQHADRTGHEVHAEQTIGVTYNRGAAT